MTDVEAILWSFGYNFNEATDEVKALHALTLFNVLEHDNDYLAVVHNLKRGPIEVQDPVAKAILEKVGAGDCTLAMLNTMYVISDCVVACYRCENGWLDVYAGRSYRYLDRKTHTVNAGRWFDFQGNEK